ncbi:MAG TPA: tetratricopeptide repeat protein, partial [Thermodesulfovibrionales bacterium]|nr:tetratricopeptide repeat protein [Thermodesulfovibrionales bacterium]
VQGSGLVPLQRVRLRFCPIHTSTSVHSIYFFMKQNSAGKKKDGKIFDPGRAKSDNRIAGPALRKIRLVPIIILILVSFGAYFNTLFNDFVYDDNSQVIDNIWIRDVRYIPDIFSKSVWSFLPGNVTSNYYRPIMHIGYMVSYHIFGLKPLGFHLVNILLHSGVTVLVFLIISRLLKESSLPVLHPLLSPPLIAALLFATHPVHTEAVAWIAGLPELSFTFWGLLSFYFYLRSGEGYDRNYLFSAASFFLAAFSKETALMLPIVIAGYDFAFNNFSYHARGRIRGGYYLKRYVPYLVIIGLYLLMRFYALGGLAPQKAHQELSTLQYVINVFPLFIQYMGKLLLPVNLNAFHVFHPVASVTEARWVLSLALIMIFVFLTWVALKRNRIAFFSACCLVLPLLPVLYIPGVGENTFAERYLYLPSFGLAILCALLISALRNNTRGWGAGFTGVCLVLTGVCFVATAYRNAVWKDDYSLFQDTVRKSPDGALPHNNLGVAYRDKGMIDKAVEQYQIALRIKPDYVEAHNNLGVVYRDKGMIDKAIDQYQIALRLRPDYPDAYNNLGAAYRDKGMIDKAIEQYQAALELKPGFAKARNNLGVAYRDKGLFDKAAEQYQMALESAPDLPDVHNNLGIAYRERGLLDEAMEQYQTALNLKPDYAEAHNNLGVVYRDKGMIDKAIDQFQLALKLKADYADPHNNMGIVYWSKGLLDKAVEQYLIALKLKPDYADAHNNLAITYRDKGLIDNAVKHYRTALRLRPDSAEIHNNLGVLYARRGSRSEAIKEFKAALAIRPDFAPARQALEALSK